MSFEDESVILSHLLDKMGYGKIMIMLRKEMFSFVSRFYSQDKRDYVLICGSRGEGISKQLESDMDAMCIRADVICTDRIWKYVSCETKIVLFTETEHSNPGYTLLRMAANRTLDISPMINECTVQMNGNVYLSAESWKLFWSDKAASQMSRFGNLHVRLVRRWRGPSIQTLNPLMNLPEDNVAGLECDCPSLFADWANRSHPYHWPPPDLISAVLNTRAHVVPIGNENSVLQLLEWRICFTEAEIILMDHLNHFYVKAWILLKAVVKRTLKPICKEITSYIVKNVILWIAERNDSANASESMLISIFQEALKFLKTCIWKNNLPSYMIKQRNLFAGRLDQRQRTRLCARIDFLLKEGPQAVLRCQTIKHYLEKMYLSPAVLERELLRLRAYELFLMEEVRLYLSKVSPEDIPNFDIRSFFQIFMMNKDYESLFQRYMPLWQSLSSDGNVQISNISEADIDECIQSLPDILHHLHIHFPLIFGL